MILRKPLSAEELQALYDLREDVLFKARGKTNYVRYQPEDRHSQNYVLGMYDQNELKGTLRLDFVENDYVILRRVAIRQECQGQGLGQRMLEKAEYMIRQEGMKKVVLNAVLKAIPFYERQGYNLDIWDENDDGYAPERNRQMIKVLE